eukprot:166414_1
MFDDQQLLSSKEIAMKRRQQCLTKLYAMDVEEICSEKFAQAVCFCPFDCLLENNEAGTAFIMLSKLFCVAGLFIGTDVALLVIHMRDNCNNMMDSRYVSFDLNIWIMISCIAHLVYSVFYCTYIYACCARQEDKEESLQYFYFFFSSLLLNTKRVAI